MIKKSPLYNIVMACVLSLSVFSNLSSADISSTVDQKQNTEKTTLKKQSKEATLNEVTSKETAFKETINVNKADAKALAKSLKGVGAKKAEAIVAFRALHGPFLSLEEMTQVKGLGKSFITKNQQRVVFK